METFSFARTLIYIHPELGGVALLCGGISLTSNKGSTPHKKFGLLFYYTMLSSALAALVISFLPNHESAFLFSISLFSSYFIIIGYRAMKYKLRNINLRWDKILALCLIITSMGMIAYPIFWERKINIILLVFGIAGLAFGLRDYHLFKQSKKLRKVWLRMHLGNMIGGYIAAVTAFIVVNDILPGVSGWFVPGVLGGFYIYYWLIKLKPEQNV